MDWVTIVPYLFGFMALAIAGWVARSIDKLADAVDSMKLSVGSLNLNVAVVIEKVANHEKRIERLEDRP